MDYRRLDTFDEVSFGELKGTPFGPKSFIFKQFLANISSDNRLARPSLPRAPLENPGSATGDLPF